MPVLRSANSPAGAGASDHPHHLVIRSLGPRHGWTPQIHHLLIAVDKFTKWIEAKPITNIRSEEAVRFFLDIIYQFSIPNCIITNHGTNFTRKKFLDFSDGYGIRIDWASVGHPCTNGQVERANGMVLQGLKPCIFDGLSKMLGNGL